MGVISTIEDALLAQANDALGNTLRQTGSLPGGWNRDTLQRAVQYAPGVYAVFAGMRPGKVDGYHAGRFAVYAVAKAVDESARRRGSAVTIGAYDMLERLLPRLDGLTIADVGTARVRGVENLFRDAMFDLGAAVYAINLELANLPLEWTLDEPSLDAFVIFDARFDINSAEADEPVAEDKVSLPQ